VTLVFEGDLRLERIVESGRERLEDLLRCLDIAILQGSEVSG
jgi:hypothetical protein